MANELNPAIAEVEPRRFKMLEISPELLLAMFKLPKDGVRVDNERITVVDDAVPEDAQAVRATINPYTGNVRLIVESKTFPETAEGSQPEYFTPSFRREELDDT